MVCDSHRLPAHIDPAQIEEIDDAMLSRLSFLSTPTQVIGIFRKPDNDVPGFTGKITLMTDNIQDPG